MDDLVKRLREPIIADAYASRAIQSSILAERLICERLDAADRIEALETALRLITKAKCLKENLTLYMVQDIARAALGEKKDG